MYSISAYTAHFKRGGCAKLRSPILRRYIHSNICRAQKWARVISSLNLKRFKKGIDLIGLKTGNFAIILSESGFEENTDYTLLTQKKVTNNPRNPETTYTDHAMTLDREFIPLSKVAIPTNKSVYGSTFK